jgi:hypothetical protein
MKNENTSDERTTNLTRRDALIRALKGTAAAAIVTPVISQAKVSVPPTPEPEFVPENDYPFFGGEVPEAYLPEA